MFENDISVEPWLKTKPQIYESLSEGRLTKDISVVLLLLQVKLFKIIGKSFHTYKLILDYSQV